jgi:hypothetical protein
VLLQDVQILMEDAVSLHAVAEPVLERQWHRLLHAHAQWPEVPVLARIGLAPLRLRHPQRPARDALGDQSDA